LNLRLALSFPKCEAIRLHLLLRHPRIAPGKQNPTSGWSAGLSEEIGIRIVYHVDEWRKATGWLDHLSRRGLAPECRHRSGGFCSRLSAGIFSYIDDRRQCFRVGLYTCELSCDDTGEVVTTRLPAQPRYLHRADRGLT
jgi:hypothetical protein